MQSASKQYKDSMRLPHRHRSYIKVDIGIINKEAQKNVSIDLGKTDLIVFSNIKSPFNGETAKKIYATAEEDFSKVDGSMFFLPSNDNYYNNGIVTKEVLGSIYISFNGVYGLDIKGLTIDFGEYYPVNFTIENENVKRSYNENNNRYFVTEDTFDGTSYIIIKPSKMINGNGRLRIYKFSCGIVNTFTNEQVLNYSLKDYVSSLSETVPSKDMRLSVDNQDLYYSVDNEESAFSYIEQGQEMSVSFGYDVTGNGDIEWIKENTAYLKNWSANDIKADFYATDIFDHMTGTYYKGRYRENGISLYELAIEVLTDYGITDESKYFIDPYLKKIIVYNALPPYEYPAVLQIIANAGRCVLYEDRDHRIHMQSSFIPDMYIDSNGQTEYSNISSILNNSIEKDSYSSSDNNHSLVDGSMFFLPKDGTYLNVGYVSRSYWVQPKDGTLKRRFSFNLGTETKYLAEAGYWSVETPKITINLESAFVAYGLYIKFRNVAPLEFKVTTYNEGVQIHSYIVENPELEYITHDQFDLFNKMEIEFTRGYPNSRIFVDNINIGDTTDYTLKRSIDLKESPSGTRENKIKAINITRNIYSKGTEEKELLRESISVSENENTYEVYFNAPSHDISAYVENNNAVSIQIIEKSDYYALLKFEGVSVETLITFIVTGKEYQLEENTYSKKYATIGDTKTWNNPLVSTIQHAKDIEEWISSYFLGYVDYKINWRGDPRTDANDLFYLELKNRETALVRAYSNSLNYDGSLSGYIEARKVVL